VDDINAGFSVYYWRPALVRHFGLAALMILGMTWLTWESWSAPIKTIRDLFGMFLAPPSAVLMVPLALNTARLLLTRQPALVVRPEGICYSPLVGRRHRVSWSEIGGFTVKVRNGMDPKTPAVSLEILSNSTPQKSILQAPANDFERPMSEIIKMLRTFADQRVHVATTVPIEDKRVPSVAATGREGARAMAAGIAVTAVIYLGVYWANRLIVDYQERAYMDNQVAGMDEELSKSAMFVAIKQVSPQDYERFRNEMRDGIQKGMTQEKLGRQVQLFCSDYMQRRLRYTTAASLKEYVRVRLNVYEHVAAESPEAEYSLIRTGGSGPTPMPNDLAQVMDSPDFASIITASQSETPVAQNDALARQRLRSLVQRLPNAEILAVAGPDDKRLNHVFYCKSFIDLNREVLKLPDPEAVQVLRYLGQLPRVDQNPPPSLQFPSHR
jgi:hypothetical protein